MLLRSLQNHLSYKTSFSKSWVTPIHPIYTPFYPFHFSHPPSYLCHIFPFPSLYFFHIFMANPPSPPFDVQNFLENIDKMVKDMNQNYPVLMQTLTMFQTKITELETQSQQ